MTWYLIGERWNQGHPHDPGSARSSRNDTPMTLPLRQVDTIFKHNWPTNMHQLNMYRNLWNCAMTLCIERAWDVGHLANQYSEDDVPFLKTSPWPLPLRLALQQLLVWSRFSKQTVSVGRRSKCVTQPETVWSGTYFFRYHGWAGFGRRRERWFATTHFPSRDSAVTW
jgi:hypothetical protein